MRSFTLFFLIFVASSAMVKFSAATSLELLENTSFRQCGIFPPNNFNLREPVSIKGEEQTDVVTDINQVMEYLYSENSDATDNHHLLTNIWVLIEPSCETTESLDFDSKLLEYLLETLRISDDQESINLLIVSPSGYTLRLTNGLESVNDSVYSFCRTPEESLSKISDIGLNEESSVIIVSRSGRLSTNSEYLSSLSATSKIYWITSNVAEEKLPNVYKLTGGYLYQTYFPLLTDFQESVEKGIYSERELNNLESYLEYCLLRSLSSNSEFPEETFLLETQSSDILSCDDRCAHDSVINWNLECTTLPGIPSESYLANSQIFHEDIVSEFGSKPVTQYNELLYKHYYVNREAINQGNTDRKADKFHDETFLSFKVERYNQLFLKNYYNGSGRVSSNELCLNDDLSDYDPVSLVKVFDCSTGETLIPEYQRSTTTESSGWDITNSGMGADSTRQICHRTNNPFKPDSNVCVDIKLLVSGNQISKRLYVTVDSFVDFAPGTQPRMFAGLLNPELPLVSYSGDIYVRLEGFIVTPDISDLELESIEKLSYRGERGDVPFSLGTYDGSIGFEKVTEQENMYWFWTVLRTSNSLGVMKVQENFPLVLRFTNGEYLYLETRVFLFKYSDVHTLDWLGFETLLFSDKEMNTQVDLSLIEKGTTLYGKSSISNPLYSLKLEHFTLCTTKEVNLLAFRASDPWNTGCDSPVDSVDKWNLYGGDITNPDGKNLPGKNPFTLIDQESQWFSFKVKFPSDVKSSVFKIDWDVQPVTGAVLELQGADKTLNNLFSTLLEEDPFSITRLVFNLSPDKDLKSQVHAVLLQHKLFSSSYPFPYSPELYEIHLSYQLSSFESDSDVLPHDDGFTSNLGSITHINILADDSLPSMKNFRVRDVPVYYQPQQNLHQQHWDNNDDDQHNNDDDQHNNNDDDDERWYESDSDWIHCCEDTASFWSRLDSLLSSIGLSWSSSSSTTSTTTEEEDFTSTSVIEEIPRTTTTNTTSSSSSSNVEDDDEDDDDEDDDEDDGGDDDDDHHSNSHKFHGRTIWIVVGVLVFLVILCCCCVVIVYYVISNDTGYINSSARRVVQETPKISGHHNRSGTSKKDSSQPSEMNKTPRTKKRSRVTPTIKVNST